MAGQKIATLAGGAAFGMSFLQNYNFYVNNNISSSEFMGKTNFDFTALKMGSSSPYGLLGASLYGATDMMYKSNNLNYQKAPRVIQLKRDIVNKFNGRYNGFYESQKQVLPYNINPWSLYPRH